LIIDSHAHLDDDAFSSEIDMVMARARAEGVGAVINPGADVASSKAAVAIAAAYPEVYALAGIHPHEAAGVRDEAIDEIAAILSSPKVVGIGEIGLDYYRELAPRDDQLRVFRAQLELARQMGLPVQIHSRDASERYVEDGAGILASRRCHRHALLLRQRRNGTRTGDARVLHLPSRAGHLWECAKAGGGCRASPAGSPAGRD